MSAWVATLQVRRELPVTAEERQQIVDLVHAVRDRPWVEEAFDVKLRVIPGPDEVIAAVHIKIDEADLDRLLEAFTELGRLIAGGIWQVGDTYSSITCDEEGRQFEVTTGGRSEIPFVGTEPAWLRASSLTSSRSLPSIDAISDDPDALWGVVADLGRNDPRLSVVMTALQHLDGNAVALAGVRRYPSYVGTHADFVYRDILQPIARSLDPSTLRIICELFLRQWNSPPSSRYWYGNLVHSFAPPGLLTRMVEHELVVAQMCRDFSELADAQRDHPDDLSCRRLEAAGTLLLESSSRSPLDVLMPIIARDKTARFDSQYESRVHLPMLRVVRKLGARV